MAAVAGAVSEVDYFNRQSRTFEDHKNKFETFIEENSAHYDEEIKSMLRQGQTRLVIDLNDVRRHDAQLGRSLLRRPMEFIAPFQAGLRSYIRQMPLDDTIKIDTQADYSIGVEGSFGAHRVTPRQLMARHLSTLVCVEGIVTKCSIVRPKVVHSVHFCDVTKEMKEVSYHDATSLTGFPTGNIYPTKDQNGNAYSTEFGLSRYMDHQTVTIQEMPERAPAGFLPSSVDAVLDRDLVDSCKPGDRVQLIGVYRALPSKRSNSTSGLFKAIVIANNVRQIGKQVAKPTSIPERFQTHIKKIARRKDVFDLLGNSIAPSIYGHEYMKKALLLLLLGGVEHNLANGTHIRGDINMLMVGDPSTAKSQLLRYVLTIAPLAINTTGRGSSGVGLTAAVTQDKETGERRLEAGAMVLGDRGVVCIDEFDKMSDNDRVAIHEVMEQQTVTIAKAGIHMSLNARCSVVAAANPQYGQYDPEESPMNNVNLPDSLLSRFDLLFIVLDNIDPEVDSKVSDHVIRNHRYRADTTSGDMDMDDEEAEETEKDAPVFMKRDRLLHGGSSKKRTEMVSLPFLKAYIQTAKATKPVLSTAASDKICKAYSDLRTKESQNKKTLPVTARSLETLIRLSSAHAKMKFKKTVDEADVDAALDIMMFALHHEITDREDDAGKKKKKSKKRGGQSQSQSQSSDDDSSDDSSGVDDTEHTMEEDPYTFSASPTVKRKSRPRAPPSAKRQKRQSPRKSPKRQPSQKSPKRQSPRKSPKRKAAAKALASVAPERATELQMALVSQLRKSHSDKCTMDELLEEANRTAEVAFERAEADAILQGLQDQNKVYRNEDFVFQI